MGWFSRKSPSAQSRLADAIAVEAEEAFNRFVAKHGDEGVVGLALCSVDDACPPYIAGATLEDIGPVDGTENTWNADPADWTWEDDVTRRPSDAIISEMLKNQPDTFDGYGRDIFEGIVEGLKKFDATGRFRGKYPRDQMILLLWINDPSMHNSEGVMKWVQETNPQSVADWFNKNYSYQS